VLFCSLVCLSACALVRLCACFGHSHDTDAFIQTTVRQAFSSTLITIAHRLQTVTDYDKVLVMEKGRCVEFDTPLNLIEANPPGYFASLVDAAGPQAALRLRASIREAATAQRAEGVTA